MGSIEKIGDDYYIEFYARGLKYQQKIGSDREAARKALEAIETKIANGEAAIIVRDVDYDIFFEDFLKNARLAHGFKTLKRYASTLEDFKNFLLRESPALKHLSEITPRVIEQYKASLRERKSLSRKSLKSKVINFTFFLLRDILEFAIKLGYLNDNPTLHIKLLPEPARPMPFKKQDFARSLCQKGVSISKLYQWMGFSDIAKAMVYSRFLAEYWQKDIYK